ncbi:MAG TPA: hypothetical protein VJW73_05175 [Gemmatimonadaceae bacterium]|nr:hypothetical protein [Gemmatimonadaceae bacterium]
MIKETQCDVFAERLADLLERDVDEASRAALETHALSCADCGALLADLRELRIDASNLPTLAPSQDLWEGISRRIDAPVIPLRAGTSGIERGAVASPRWRRWASMSAAAVLLVAATAASTYYLTIRFRSTGSASALATLSPAAPDTNLAARESTPPRTAAVVDSARQSAPVSKQSAPVSSQSERVASVTPAPGARLVSAKPSAEQVYTSEIARLRIIVDRRRAQLDPVTVGVIERNLKVIDDAIAQCKLALTKDPASRFLMESLNNALENKVQLLRTATMLPARS